VLERFPYHDASFEFVHQRLFVFGIPLERWPALIQELVCVTSDGGWVALVECDLHFSLLAPTRGILSVGLTLRANNEGLILALAQRSNPFSKRLA